jgi:hypothetical protein
MAQAIVKIISPVLHDGVWLNSGEHPMPLDDAQALERTGMVDIVSVDGERVVWAVCCTGADHNHG